MEQTNTNVQPVLGDPQDVEQNKVYAILAYISILFLVPLLAAPNSKFAKFHANQGLILFIASIILNVGGIVVGMLPLGFILQCLSSLVWIPIIILAIMGILNAINGKMEKLPIIGNFELIK